MDLVPPDKTDFELSLVEEPSRKEALKSAY